LTVDQITNLQSSFEENYSGASNAFRMIILEEGMEFQAMGMSMLDAQFVESRKLTLEDVARIYRVPPPAIGILDRATYSNISEQSRSLVMHTLRPWLVRIEQAMNAALLTVDGRRSHFIEHNAEGLLRGTQKDRYEAYQIGREWGWLNVNEIRRRENLSNIGSGGDVYSERGAEPATA
jgi:HK97 family phage portal protein